MNITQSIEQEIQNNFKLLNSMKENEQFTAIEYFKNVLSSPNGFRVNLVDFLLKNYNTSSIRVQHALISLFLECKIPEAFPIFLDVLKNLKEESELTEKVMEKILDFQDEKKLSEIARLLFQGSSNIKKLILIKLLSSEEEKLNAFCWSLSYLEEEVRKEIFKILVKASYQRIVKFILKSFMTAPAGQKKIFLLECFYELNLIDKYIDLLASLDKEMGKLGAIALRKIDINLVNHLLKALAYKDERTKLKIIELFEYIGDKNLEIPLKVLLANEKNEKIVSKAIKVYSEFAEPQSIINVALPLLKRDDPRIRANAVEALEKAGEPAIKILKDYIIDPNNRVRANVAKILASKWRDLSLKVLYMMLEDPEPEMQASALWVLGEIRECKAELKIREYLDHHNELLRRNAKKALEKITLTTENLS